MAVGRAKELLMNDIMRETERREREGIDLSNGSFRSGSCWVCWGRVNFDFVLYPGRFGSGVCSFGANLGLYFSGRVGSLF